VLVGLPPGTYKVDAGPGTERRVALAVASTATLDFEVAKQPVVAAVDAGSTKRKLSFKDQRELELLPGRIESLESQIAALTAEMNTPAFYQRGSGDVQAANKKLADVQAELEVAYARWSELE